MERLPPAIVNPMRFALVPEGKACASGAKEHDKLKSEFTKQLTAVGKYTIRAWLIQIICIAF